MNYRDPQASDLQLMRRCIALAKSGRSDREYPFADVVRRQAEFVCMVRRKGDVTRHAEMVALSAAQQTLRTLSLDDCTLYSTVETCAMCAYAIRESGIGRVIFGLHSPVLDTYRNPGFLLSGHRPSKDPLSKNAYRANNSPGGVTNEATQAADARPRRSS